MAGRYGVLKKWGIGPRLGPGGGLKCNVNQGGGSLNLHLYLLEFTLLSIILYAPRGYVGSEKVLVKVGGPFLLLAMKWPIHINRVK